ncbi:MAG: SMP-30/gluconolactonase/LRE family protein, partial [Vicinamibacterales bacterium]
MKRLVLLACVVSLMGGGAATLVRARAQAGAVSPIERLDPEADAILPAGATIEVIRQDFFGATEGATWVPDGGYLAFSDMGSNRIWKWDPAAKALSVLMEKAGIAADIAPGSPAITKVRALDNGRLQIAVLGTNGLGLDSQGRLVFCAHGDRAIVRREKDGTRTILADRWDGKRFNGPNDLAVKSDGSIYFTDLGAQLLGGFANSPDRELDFQGVFRWTPDGRVRLVARVPANGIAFSPDEKYLYVGLNGITRYTLLPDGSVTNPVRWISRGADGFRVDRNGFIYGGSWIANPDGKIIANINLPPGDNVTNVGLGDADGRGLYIGTYRSLYRIRMGRSAWDVVPRPAPGPTAPAPAAYVPRFEYDPSWPKPLPENWVLGEVAGVGVDASDHIWVTNRPQSHTDFSFAACCAPAPPIIEFDQAGNVVQAWGGPGAGYEWPSSEHGMFVDHEGSIWLSSNNLRDSRDPQDRGTHVLKFSKAGKFLLQIGKRGVSKGDADTANMNQPAGLFVEPSANELYVADGYGNHRVIVYDAKTGAYKRHWGAYGKPPGSTGPSAGYTPAGAPPTEFATVHCAKVSRDGLVYVCDRANHRLQVFRTDGTFVREVFIAPTTGGYGTVGEIAFSPDPAQQFLYVLDGRNAKVWILRRDDLAIVGSFGRGGHQAGGFITAHSMDADSKGNLYIGESRESYRVQRFRLV